MRKNILFLKLILILSSIISPLLVRGEIKRILSNIDGLSNNSVNCILEDDSQVIWIGTWDGLNMYDGRSIVSFRYSKNDSNTISNNVIRHILEDGESLWIATDNGVNKIDKVSKKISRYYLQNEIPAQENAYIIGKSLSGDILCWMKGKGLFYYDFNIDDFIFSGLILQDDIVDFKIDNRGNVFFLTSDGKVKYTDYSSLLQNKILDCFPPTKNLKVDKMLYCNKSIVFVVSDTLYFIDDILNITDVITLCTNKNITSVMRKDELIYVGLVGGGCLVYNVKTKEKQILNEISNQVSITSIYQGSQDLVWLGTDGKGVFQLLPYHTFFHTVEVSNPVRCFCENKLGNILIGTKGSGVKLYNKQTSLLSDFLGENQGLGSMSVYALTKNKSHDVFIGTEDRGIDVLYENEKKVSKLNIPDSYPFFQSVYSICFTNNDSLLWIGTSGYGLIKINIEKYLGKYKVAGMKQYVSYNSGYSLNNDIVYAIVPDSSGKYVWFGTRGGGINRVSISGNEILSIEEIYPNVQLTNNDVLSLLQDGDVLWIGTSYGLNKLNLKNGFVTQYAEQLINKTIHSILKDQKGGIWVGTNQGLLHFDRQNDKFDNYTFIDGLHNNELADGAAYRMSDDCLFFGGVDGFSYFYADSIHLRTFDPKLVLSELKIFNKVHDINKRIVGNKLKLGYDERTLSLTFLAKDFIKNSNCEYAYRLLNNSSDWVYLGNDSKITFAQLPSGKFLLEVKATNGDKVWGTHICRLEIQVAYPWWLSMYAIVIYALLLIIVFYITKRIIISRIRLSKQIFLAKVETAHEQKLYESKLNFFMNVAHEFFTPLTLIYTPVQYLLEQNDIKSSSRKYLNLIKTNAERMQKLIQELMEFRKVGNEISDVHPEQININEFLNMISDNYIEIFRENKIDFKLILNQNNVIVSTDRNALEKIVFNLLSNAFKYTPSGGYIIIQSDIEINGTLALQIKNSGKGLTSKQMSEIFNRYKIFDSPNIDGAISNGIGLNLTKQLVEMLKGNISVDSKLGEYVEFCVKLPSLPLSSSILLNEKTSEQVLIDNNKDHFVSQFTILLVEDDDEICSLIEVILKDYVIKRVPNGKEALNFISDTHPDLILTDRMMDEMDGLSLTKKLKSDVKTSYIPIVMISGKSTIEDQIEACKCGVDSYIVKPFHPMQVISIVSNLISRQCLLKDYFNSSLSIVKKTSGYEIPVDDEKLIKQVADIIVENIDDELLSSNFIAEKLGMSKSTLYRKLKGTIDKTPNEFIREFRLDYAGKLLRTTQLTVTEIMYKSGFLNKSYFYREFLKHFGDSPKDYRQKKI